MHTIQKKNRIYYTNLSEVNENNQGKFKVDFSYDKIDDEKCDHATRCIVWEYKRVGITYKECSYSHEILDKYLKENI